jgi:hypothetical protein
MVIHRLRKAIEQAVGGGAARQLIECGDNGEYRLTVERKQIAVDASFEELSSGAVVGQETWQVLQGAFDRVSLS